MSAISISNSTDGERAAALLSIIRHMRFRISFSSNTGCDHLEQPLLSG